MAKQLFTRHIQINHIPKHPRRNLSETFAVGFEPPKELSNEYGNLYICYESSPDSSRLNPNNIIQRCGKAFYESGLETEFEKRFRLCLRALNELIIEAKTTCNISIIATQNGNLLFSNVGTCLMLHVRRGNATDLSAKTHTDRFTEIGQGKLISGDKLLLASKVIAHSLTIKEITKLLTDYPLDDISGLLDGKLTLPNDLVYSFILIGCEKIDINTESLDNKRTTPKEITSPDKNLAKFGLSLQRLREYIIHQSKKAGNKIQKSTKSVFTKILPNFASKTKHGWTSFWSKYINPNPRQAIIVVIITIIIIITVIWGALVFFNNNNRTLQQFQQANALIDSAQINLDKNNKSAAKEAITKANDILNTLNQSDQNQINKLATLKKIDLNYATARQRAQSIEDKLNNIVRLSLDSGFSIPQSNLSGLIWTSNALFGINPVDGSIIEINPLLGAPINRGSTSDLIENSSSQVLSSGGLIAIGKTSLWQYTPTNGLQQLKASNLPQSVDIASYLNNIYLLSPSENQVIRYVKSGTNLSGRTNLLKNLFKDSLTSASALSVSGDVFIAQSKEIRLFEAGSERSYKLNNMPDDFGEFSKLYYNPERSYFLILNKLKTRLALLTTESDSASFVRQYALSGDAPIQAFTVEPVNSQLMLSSGNKIITNKIEK